MAFPTHNPFTTLLKLFVFSLPAVLHSLHWGTFTPIILTSHPSTANPLSTKREDPLGG
jgi:hypothetical protein